MTAQIHIGTSGYSYDDWVGPIYPADVKKTDWLNYYAEHLFHTTEINYTYYRLPAARTLKAMADKTPPGFQFTIKASQELTHGRDAPDAFEKFTSALWPLLEADKFGCVLAQFPTSFHNTPQNQDYLRRLRERLSDLPTVVEFRNREWIEDDVFELLRECRLGFCAVDQPQFKTLVPPVAWVTGPISYVRFHGRNYQKWFAHEESYERYNYSYSDEELQEWVPKIEKMAQESEKLFAFANNHYQGQSVTTAQQISRLLQQAGLPLPS
ncbi:MAG: DUF72 domain-containing protein [Anaerolineae bacterium]